MRCAPRTTSNSRSCFPPSGTPWCRTCTAATSRWGQLGRHHRSPPLLIATSLQLTTSYSRPRGLQALHHTRVNIEADFGELCEEHELREKLHNLEVMCEEQGIADGDAAEAARWAQPCTRHIQRCPLRMPCAWQRCCSCSMRIHLRP